MESNQLPDKLSALIRVALNDLEKAEKAKDVVIDMDVFHDIMFVDEDRKHKVCSVCLAGTVMIGSLGGDPYDDRLSTLRWGDDVRKKLYALDQVRLGQLENALMDIYHLPGQMREVRQLLYKAFPELSYQTPAEQRLYFIPVPEYDRSKDGFKRVLNEIADKLEGVDL